MNIIIGEKEYTYVSNAFLDEIRKDSYLKLVKDIFGLDFTPWDQSGFRNNAFLPHTLFCGDVAVASVGVVTSNFKWNGNLKRYVQISTVVTARDYRKKGLSQWLMNHAINECKENVDAIYLYANDSVVNFYPKFGFHAVNEYQYQMQPTKNPGAFRKLNINSKSDLELLICKYSQSNPFSSMVTFENLEMLMFHCVTFLRENIYYLEQYDAVVIAEQDGDELFCYDIYTKENGSIRDMLSIITSDNTKLVTLGFTPKDPSGYSVNIAQKKNTTVFVYSEKENLFGDNKIMLPVLSRA